MQDITFAVIGSGMMGGVLTKAASDPALDNAYSRYGVRAFCSWPNQACISVLEGGVNRAHILDGTTPQLTGKYAPRP